METDDVNALDFSYHSNTIYPLFAHYHRLCFFETFITISSIPFEYYCP